MKLQGVAFEYANRLTLFEFGAALGSSKVVLFIGGLTDGLLTVPYLPALAEELSKKGWGLVQIIFSSSYIGWGTGSLERDAQEIGLLVKYLRSTDGGARDKIVLMGHSTGCQDTMQYLTKFEKAKLEQQYSVDGGILQLPVSDREAMAMWIDSKTMLLLDTEAKEVYDKDPLTVLGPTFTKKFFGTPINAYRWLSLSQPKGDDDFFSSDLDDQYLEENFSRIEKPLLVLYSGSDESVPPHVDKLALIKRWLSFSQDYWSPHSTVVPEASHNYGPPTPQSLVDKLLETVSAFLSDL